MSTEDCALVLRENEQQLLVLLQRGVALHEGFVTLFRELLFLRGENKFFSIKPLDEAGRLNEFLIQIVRTGRQIITNGHAENLKPQSQPKAMVLLAFSQLAPVVSQLVLKASANPNLRREATTAMRSM